MYSCGLAHLRRDIDFGALSTNNTGIVTWRQGEVQQNFIPMRRAKREIKKLARFTDLVTYALPRRIKIGKGLVDEMDSLHNNSTSQLI